MRAGSAALLLLALLLTLLLLLRPSRALPPLCRQAVSRGTSPDLAAALHGVTHIKLFLAGEGVRAGLPVEELAKLAASSNMALVLPSGQGLGLVGGHPTAVPLWRLWRGQAACHIGGPADPTAVRQQAAPVRPLCPLLRPLCLLYHTTR